VPQVNKERRRSSILKAISIGESFFGNHEHTMDSAQILREKTQVGTKRRTLVHASPTAPPHLTSRFLNTDARALGVLHRLGEPHGLISRSSHV
jgi:hypothetical protein